MVATSFKEMLVATTLYEAYQQKVIPDDPRFPKFVKQHQAFTERRKYGCLARTVVLPATIFYYYRCNWSPRVVLALFFANCFLIFVTPRRVSDEEIAFVKRVGPEYIDLLIKQHPWSQKIYIEMLGRPTTVGANLGTYFPHAREPARGQWTGDLEGRLGQERREEYRGEPQQSEPVAAGSHYMTPGDSSKPYVYGSLSETSNKSRRS